MRLIDADRLKTVIDKNMMNNEVKDMFNQYIDVQPTAYDVDKVVEELKDEKEWAENDFWEFLAIDAEIALEIVKRGGVDD